MIIGIDLGTSNSVAAYMGENGPSIIPNSLERPLTPSVVGIDHDGALIIGDTAKELMVTNPERCASLFKRYMGEDKKIKLLDKEYSPEELSSLVLKSLKEDAEAFLKQPVKGAVITVPAYFNDTQRNATIKAGKLAGLKVERIINEPTAASIAYGLQEEDDEKILIVFDLGGGTFDVSLVEIFEGTVEVQASSGEAFLGGEDFTQAIAAKALQEVGMSLERMEMKERERFSRLLRECEKVKKLLSRQEEAVITVPDEDASTSNSNLKITVSREDLSEWTKHILERVEAPVRRCLGDSQVTKADIDEVILVGGATRMTTLVDRVRDLFSKNPLSRLDPDLVVAMGATVQGGLISNNEALEDLVVTDVAPFTLGVETTKAFGDNYRPGYFLPVISRNTTIPVSRVERVATVNHGQREVEVNVYQGESRRVKDNLKLGSFSVKGIPPGPSGQQVDIRLTYDLNGVLEVEATIVQTGKKANLVIKSSKCQLSDKELKDALKKMSDLKVHPREEAKNRFMLKRAERAFKELDQHSRQELEYMIDAFEAAMETQDSELCNRVRVELGQLLKRLNVDIDDGDGEN